MRIGLSYLFVILTVLPVSLFSSDLQEILKMKKIKEINRESELLIRDKKFDLAREKIA